MTGSDAQGFGEMPIGDELLDRSMLERLLERSPHAVILVAADWRVSFVNRKAAELANNPVAKLIGDKVWTAFPFLEGAQLHCQRALQKQADLEFELQLPNDRWLQVCVCPEQQGFALYCTDITAFKLAETALREREAELQDFFENGNVPLHWVGPDGTILWANTAELTMLGYSEDEYVGCKISDFHADPAIIEDILRRLASNEKLDSYESALRCKDGSIRHVAISSSVYRKNGAFVHTRCFTRDISAEKARAEVQERLVAIVHSSDDAIVSKDLNGVITSWNMSAERIFGYSAHEAIGQTVAGLLIPEDRQDEEPDILSRLHRGERVDHFQTKRKRKDGTLLDISLTISPVRDSKGSIVGASKIARDITEQVRNLEALQRANEALKRSNADLEQFAYSASHDLQEPLRMVSTYGEMLKKKYREKLDAQADEYIGYIVEGAARMERLLRDLRAFTQATLEQESSPPAVDSQGVFNSALLNLKTAIQESQAQITVGLLPRVRIHEFQLSQIFQNIIGNAIHYRSEALPRIHVEAQRDGDFWRFSIEDNGIGIESEYKEQIFGIFTRLHPASDYSGTGMGLAICQRIVERAGGRIWVESEPQRGSTFFFTLPAQLGN